MNMTSANNIQKFLVFVLLSITLALSILTAAYQGWYVVIRIGIVLPLFLFLSMKGKAGSIATTAFLALGAFAFTVMIHFWSIYPIRVLLLALEIPEYTAEKYCQSVEIAIFGVFIFFFIFNRVGLIRRGLIVVPWILVETICIALMLANFIWRASITIELGSYVTFYAAMGLMTLQRSAVILNKSKK
jgi:hypothetical protein